MPTWPRRIVRLAHGAVVIAAAAVILGSLGLLAALAAFDERVERATVGLPPAQFLGVDDGGDLADHAAVFGVAHNSGDALRATVRALVHGADVVEIDVIAVGGQLYAGHEAPTWILGGTSFRGTPLREAWAVAAAADAIQLDLKAASPADQELVLAFLAARPGGPPVAVSSPDAGVLRAVAERAPRAVRLLSVGTRSRLTALAGDPDLIALIDGVSIREDLVDEETAAWLRERGLQIWAWTANRPERVAELAELGVDAVTTDDLAILEALGGPGEDERRVGHRSAAPEEPDEEEDERDAGGGGGEERPAEADVGLPPEQVELDRLEVLDDDQDR